MESTMTLNDYIEEKIEMLTDPRGFHLPLDSSEIFQLRTAQNEIQCDQIAHTLFNKYM